MLIPTALPSYQPNLHAQYLQPKYDADAGAIVFWKCTVILL